MNLLDIALSSITFLITKEKVQIKKNLDSVDKLAVLSKSELEILIGRSIGNAIWNPEEVLNQAKKSFAIIQKLNISGSIFTDDDFPTRLKEIPDCPYMIFYRGNLNILEKPCISIVGTRRICLSVKKATIEFAKQACLNGNVIVSGLAYGVDAASHLGALSSLQNGATVAVIPSGIDTIVPYGNVKLAQKILENGGLILSEYVPGTPAQNYRFVQRNRIIAALSEATVVMQAPSGSGSLLTADFALGYSRDLMFHKEGFCEQALEIDRQIELKNKINGKIKKSGKSYIMEGAPVISNYQEFIEVFTQPEKHNISNDLQLSLF